MCESLPRPRLARLENAFTAHVSLELGFIDRHAESALAETYYSLSQGLSGAVTRVLEDRQCDGSSRLYSYGDHVG